MIKTTFFSLLFFASASFSSFEKGPWNGSLPSCDSDKYSIFFNHQELSSDEILSAMALFTWNSYFEPTGYPKFLSGLTYIVVEAQIKNPNNQAGDALKHTVELTLSFLRGRKGISLECKQ